MTLVNASNEVVRKIFKKEFADGLELVQGCSDEIIELYCTAPMRPMPLKLRVELAKDPFMALCIYRDEKAPNHGCSGRITWEHAFLNAGKQINEAWAIVPCCLNHNSGSSMVKSYNQYRSMLRAKELGVWDKIKAKYPRTDWEQQFKYLSKKYGKG